MKERRRRSTYMGLAAALLTALLCGCASKPESRGEQSEAFLQSAEERTHAALSAGGAMDLSRCVAIALENNLDVTKSDIEARLARLDRQAAFSSFLPSVQVKFSYNSNSDQQAVWTGSDYFAMSDKDLTMTAVTVQESVFMPQAWLMYSMAQSGEDIKVLVAARARQLVTLQVALKYYACLSISEAQAYLEESASAAEAMEREVRALRREGLATDSEEKKVEAFAAARRSEAEANKRAQAAAKAALLDTMGLSPLVEITLAESEDRERDERELSEQVSAALVNRLELSAADKAVEISRDSVRRAVADFLPSLILVGGYVNSSDSYLKYSGMWNYGVTGVMTVFDGFRNVSSYRAAREMREKAFVAREQTSLAIMLEVVRARQLADDAEDAVGVTQKVLAASESEASESEALWREGMATESGRLEAAKNRDTAWAQSRIAEYRRQVARVTLAAVIGQPRRQEEQ